MNTDKLPDELAEGAGPDDAEAWLGQYAVALSPDLNWSSVLTRQCATGRWPDVIDEQAAQRLDELEPSRHRAVAILAKAGRDPGQVFQDVRAEEIVKRLKARSKPRSA